MGRSVLAYQFVTSLLPHLKSKLAGSDGRFEELLTKARFEEAKYRDVIVLGNEQTLPNAANRRFRQMNHNLPREAPQQRKGKEVLPLWWYKPPPARLSTEG